MVKIFVLGNYRELCCLTTNDSELLSLEDYNSLANSDEKIKNQILKHSDPLIRPLNSKKNSMKVFYRFPDDVKLTRSHGKVAFDSRKNRTFRWRVRFMKPIVLHVKSTDRNRAISQTKLKKTE